MPFVERALIDAMLKHADRADVIVPRLNGYYEPLHAVYRKTCLKAVEDALARGKKKMISFFPQVSVHPIEEAELAVLDPGNLSTFNVNTPRDLHTAEEILKKSKAV